MTIFPLANYSRVLLLFLFFPFVIPHGEGATTAVVICARAGEQRLADANHEYCRKLLKVLSSEGLDSERVTVFIDDDESTTPKALAPTRKNILDTLSALGKALGEKDTLLVFLFGHGNVTSRGFSLATKGGRTTGKDIGVALDAISCPQVVFCLNTGASALLSMLGDRNNRMVLSATDNDGELNPPLLPKYLFSSWLENPDAPILDAFKKGSKLTREYYTSNGLGLAESPAIFNGHATFNYPFENLPSEGLLAQPLSKLGVPAPRAERKTANSSETSEPPPPSATTGGDKITPLDFSEFDSFHINPDILVNLAKEPPLAPPTEESLSAISKAKEMSSRYKGYNAFFVQDTTVLTVNADHSTVRRRDFAIFLRSAVAAETYAKMSFNDSPPESALSISKARVIYPDGSSRTAKINSFPDPARHRCWHLIRFPAATAGVLLEISLERAEKPTFQLDAYSASFIVQREIPVASSKLTLRLPKRRDFRVKLYNATATPTRSENDYCLISKYDFGSLDAIEKIPYSPPLENRAVRGVVSSMKTWGDFVGWLDRIVGNSDKIDKKTADFATKLTAAEENPAGKLKRLYEFLCDLRYDTEPVGIMAFRPRPPGVVCASGYGDCKDKANALVALAGAVGIKGYRVLLNRQSTTDKDFPSWQFNHEIAYFPELAGYPGGLWCDPTDGSTPFGVLPPGDIGRESLVLKGKGFEFKKILPAYFVANRLEETIDLGETSGKASVEIKATGLNDYFLRRKLKRLSAPERIVFVQSLVNTSLTGLSVKDVETSPLEDLSTPLTLKMECSSVLDKYSFATIAPPIDLWSMVAAETRTTTLKLFDNQPFTMVQTVVIHAPLPKQYHFRESEKHCAVKVDFVPEAAGETKRILEINVNAPSVPAADYASFRRTIIKWYSNMRRQNE